MTQLAKYDKQIRQMRAIGKTCREIAEAIGSNKDLVKWYCRTRNVAIPEDLKQANVLKFANENRNTEDDVRRKIARRNPKLEYVSGYVNKQGPVIVKCLVCYKEFQINFHTIYTRGGSCPHCRNKITEERRAEKERAKSQKQMERENIAKKRQEEKEQKRKEREHPCSVCGTITSRPTYCSDKCAKKAKNSRKEAARRARISNQLVDKDITLESLFKRDKGICHICGGRCDYEDYTVRDEVFIAGDWYPSIDHVVALSNGGKHSWGNVRLAHRLCNTKKSNR